MIPTSVPSFSKFQSQFATAKVAPKPDVPGSMEALRAGFQAHQSGDVGTAAQQYALSVQRWPQNPDALHLAGVLQFQCGDPLEGIRLIRRSLDLNSQQPDAWLNLGSAQMAAGELTEAERSYRSALRLAPDRADGLYNLANLLVTLERFEEAEILFTECLDRAPGHRDARLNLARMLYRLGRFEAARSEFAERVGTDPTDLQAILGLGACLGELGELSAAAEVLEAALPLAPNHAGLLNNLGSIQTMLRQADRAVKTLELARRAAPSDVEIRRNLVRALTSADLEEARRICETEPRLEAVDHALYGCVLHQLGENPSAVLAYREAARLDPESVFVTAHFGMALAAEGELDEAIPFFQALLQRRPDTAEAVGALALAHKDAGDLPAALEGLRRAVEMDPANDELHSSLVLTLNYDPGSSPHEIRTESERFAVMKTPEVRPRPARRAGSRPIRIGYLSADFHRHPAGYFYQGLFPHHDRERFRVHTFINQPCGDEVTHAIIRASDEWTMVKYRSDEEVARCVREQEIDLFIDLLGHTNNHRLRAFGQRPAPVQASWLGYFGTTGLPQMDYLICDEWTVPSAEESWYVERPARIPGGMYIYQLPDVDVTPGPLPMETNGYVTYGCFNNLAKVTPEVVALWSRVLRADPSARMILNRWPFKNASVRDRYAAMFAAEGIDPSRVEMRATQGRHAYFAGYRDVDLMLDSFPFSGGTTTVDAWWMGVEVVNLVAPRFVGRMTESLAHSTGWQDQLVFSPEAYLERALSVEARLLAAFRRSARESLAASPLCDIPGFARRLESTYETMLASV